MKLLQLHVILALSVFGQAQFTCTTKDGATTITGHTGTVGAVVMQNALNESITGTSYEFASTQVQFTSLSLLRLKTIAKLGEYEICDVCGWEDDPPQSSEPDYAGGANRLSLNEARKEWSASAPDP